MHLFRAMLWQFKNYLPSDFIFVAFQVSPRSNLFPRGNKSFLQWMTFKRLAKNWYTHTRHFKGLVIYELRYSNQQQITIHSKTPSKMMRCLGIENVLNTIKVKCTSHEAHMAGVNPRLCSTRHPGILLPPHPLDGMLVHGRVTPKSMLPLLTCTPGRRVMV